MQYLCQQWECVYFFCLNTKEKTWRPERILLKVNFTSLHRITFTMYSFVSPGLLPVELHVVVNERSRSCTAPAS